MSASRCLRLLLPSLLLATTIAWAALPPAIPSSAGAPAEAGATPAPASDAPTTDAGGLTTLAPVVVTGIQPGPGLWQVRRNGNTLWIVATLSPLPKRIDWEPRELDALVARADRVLTPPRFEIDAEIGFFGRLRLVPSALRARNNPEDRRLAEILPPELYARWEVQKAKYLGRDRSIERRRPFIAAYELTEAAYRELDLRRDNIVWKRVERQARRHQREIVPVSVQLKLEDPREALREFERSGLDDIACLEATLARLENDTRNMVLRANAWAVGDLAALRELPFESELRACALALLGSESLKKRGFAELPRRSVEEWVRVAEESLARHATTVAVADFQLLTNDDGLLAALRARGYEIIEPGTDAAVSPTDGPAPPLESAE